MKILLLAGGDSAEREISLLSGENMRDALLARGHQVFGFDPAEAPLDHLPAAEYDVACLALHGTFGEDGRLQELLEQLGIPYTGSGPEASRLAFHKPLAKARFERCGVRTPPGVLFRAADTAESVLQQIGHWAFPFFVKPSAQGSSIGVSCVTSAAELPAALRLALLHDDTGLVEPAIAGHEWTVAVFGEQRFPAVGIQSAAEFFDYDAKYHDTRTAYLEETDLSAGVRELLQLEARRAYDALHCSGLARVDLIVDRAGLPWVLEVNTLPGMTRQSLVPRAAALLGWSLGELCERMCVDAIQRRPRQSLQRRA